jgi:hypothetical protein
MLFSIKPGEPKGAGTFRGRNHFSSFITHFSFFIEENSGALAF